MLTRLLGGLANLLSPPPVHKEGSNRVRVPLRSGPSLYAEVMPDVDGDVIVYSWPTSMTAKQLLTACLPFSERGQSFDNEVEILVFADDVKKLEVPEYLSEADGFDQARYSVRFNSDAFGGFSVVWSPADLSNSSSGGQVDAIFRRTPDMMNDMIDVSIIPDARRQGYYLLSQGRQLQKSVA